MFPSSEHQLYNATVSAELGSDLMSDFPAECVINVKTAQL